MIETWKGYELQKTELDGREVIIVKPDKEKTNGKWALKTEYFDAFPDVQIRLLEKGYHIAHIKNKTRWHVPSDTEARAKLSKYMHIEMGLSEKCVIIGMSCGGMQGIYFAAKYPDLVSCMYLDAPVVNLLSCPADLGKARGGAWDEFERDVKMTKSELISYRNHPLDNLCYLTKRNIPIILVCGDSDSIVPYEENGMLIKMAYEEKSCTIKTVLKEGCDHHPHSLEDNSEIIDFILKYDR